MRTEELKRAITAAVQEALSHGATFAEAKELARHMRQQAEAEEARSRVIEVPPGGQLGAREPAEFWGTSPRKLTIQPSVATGRSRTNWQPHSYSSAALAHSLLIGAQ